MAQVTLDNLTKEITALKTLDRTGQLAFMQQMALRLKGRKLSGMTTYGKLFAMSVQLEGFNYDHHSIFPPVTPVRVESADEAFRNRAKDQEHFAMLPLSIIREVSLGQDATDRDTAETRRTFAQNRDYTEDLCMDTRGNLFIVRGRHNITLENSDEGEPTATIVLQRIEVIAKSEYVLDILDQVPDEQWPLQEMMTSLESALSQTQASLQKELEANTGNLQLVTGVKALL